MFYFLLSFYYDIWKDDIPTIHFNDVECYNVTYIIISLVSCLAKTFCIKAIQYTKNRS